MKPAWEAPDDRDDVWVSVRLRLRHAQPDFASLLAEAQPYAPELRVIRIIKSERKYCARTGHGYSDVTLLVPEGYVVFWRVHGAMRGLTFEEMAARWTMERATAELWRRDKLIPF
jgi:hypothetical protein